MTDKECIDLALQHASRMHSKDPVRRGIFLMYGMNSKFAQAASNMLAERQALSEAALAPSVDPMRAQKDDDTRAGSGS